MSNETQSAHQGLQDLFSYPFMSCLAERRTRRIARGTSIDAGPLSYTSTNNPSPLSKLEEAILIVCTGVTGLTTHDGPLSKPDGERELGTPFLNIVARAASSADNCQATSFFMINDDGMFLLRQAKGRAALDQLKDLPPRWADWTEEHWLHVAESVKVPISKRRMEFPREFPYYLGWNRQISNRPGTTIFFPVVDCTWQYINAILILLSEPDGQRPLFLDDFRRFHPHGFKEILAWLGSELGLTQNIPFQPIGGLKWIENGFVNRNVPAPLGLSRALRTDYESLLAMQNLMLVGQALGVGGWIHSSIFPPYIYQCDPSKGWHGLGFRMLTPKTLSPEPAPPASQPNPVGIDNILEGLCPPYVKSMDEAVERVLEAKYGQQGAYGDATVFSRPYRRPRDGEAYLQQASHYSDRAIAYTKEICSYLYETYGRFPAHVDAFYTTGMWVQFSHLELEYYERFFDPQLYIRQRQHDALWNSSPSR
jgi:hypothetical protein